MAHCLSWDAVAAFFDVGHSTVKVSALSWLQKLVWFSTQACDSYMHGLMQVLA